MTKQEFEGTRQIIEAYAEKREKVKEIRDQLLEDVTDRKRNGWVVDRMIHQLYEDLTNSEESKLFCAESMKVKDDPEFEKHFRAAGMKYFLSVDIDPNDL